MQKEHQEEVKQDTDGTAKKSEPQEEEAATKEEGEGASAENGATENKDEKEPTASGIQIALWVRKKTQCPH